MSLICNECGQEMGPSEELPGREGTIVHPNLLSLIYTPSDNRKESDLIKHMGDNYRLGYIFAPENRSLCFECIERGLPAKRKEDSLRKIYDAYEMETKWRSAEKEHEKLEGQLISFGHPLLIEKLKTFEDYEKVKNKISSNCLFCDKDVKNGKPFFQAFVIDKVYSMQHLSWFNTNYSFSNMKNGSTNFRICFEDFSKYFPDTFKQLSYDLIEEANPDIMQMRSQLYIDPSIKEVAEKEGIDLDKWKKDFEDMGVDVIDEDD